jgi:hypothetical protein
MAEVTSSADGWRALRYAGGGPAFPGDADVGELVMADVSRRRPGGAVLERAGWHVLQAHRGPFARAGGGAGRGPGCHGLGRGSHLRRSLANLAQHNITQLTALVKTRLRRMQ